MQTGSISAVLLSPVYGPPRGFLTPTAASNQSQQADRLEKNRGTEDKRKKAGEKHLNGRPLGIYVSTPLVVGIK